MTAQRPHDPFQCYIGKAVTLRNRSYVVERSEVVGRELSFVLRDTSSGMQQHVSPLELVALEPGSQSV